MALVQVLVRQAAEVRPELLRVLAVLAAVHHRRDVGAERNERGACVERARPERLDRLVICGGDHRQARRNAGRGGGGGGDLAERSAPGITSSNSIPGFRLKRRCSADVGAPLPGVRIDRPLQQDVVRRGVAELAREAVRDVAGRRRRVARAADRRGRTADRRGCPSSSSPARAASHRPSGTPCSNEWCRGRRRRSRAGRRRTLRGPARLAAAIESQRSSSGCCTMPGRGRSAGRSGLPAFRHHVAGEIVDDDLRALRAVVDADEVTAGHALVVRLSGRGSRRRPPAGGR